MQKIVPAQWNEMINRISEMTAFMIHLAIPIGILFIGACVHYAIR